MYHDGPLNRTSVIRRSIDLKPEGSWHEFDVTSVVSSWIQNRRRMYGLQIEAVDSDGTDLPVMIPKHSGEHKYVSDCEVIDKYVSDHEIVDE